MTESKVKNRVKECRKRAGVRQADLAEQIGITRQTVIAVEQGRLTPSVFIALRMGQILGVQVENLFWVPEHPASEAPPLPAIAPAVVAAPQPEPAAVVAETVPPQAEPVTIEGPAFVSDFEPASPVSEFSEAPETAPPAPQSEPAVLPVEAPEEVVETTVTEDLPLPEKAEDKVGEEPPKPKKRRKETTVDQMGFLFDDDSSLFSDDNSEDTEEETTTPATPIEEPGAIWHF
jgi:putative transcriptional regulator